MLCVGAQHLRGELLGGDAQSLAYFLSAVGLRMKRLIHQSEHLLQGGLQLGLNLGQLQQAAGVQTASPGQHLSRAGIARLKPFR